MANHCGCNIATSEERGQPTRMAKCDSGKFRQIPCSDPFFTAAGCPFWRDFNERAGHPMVSVSQDDGCGVLRSVERYQYHRVVGDWTLSTCRLSGLRTTRDAIGSAFGRCCFDCALSRHFLLGRLVTGPQVSSYLTRIK